MGYPIKLVTKEGQELFDEINKEFLGVRRIGGNIKELFHLSCDTDYKLALKDIISFLNDIESVKKHKLTDDDVEGLSIYKKMSDECSVLNYFRNIQL